VEARTLLFDLTHGVATLTFNRPEVLNALDIAQWSELAAMLDRVQGDSSIRALVLTGVGRAFSAGADIRAMRQPRSAAQQTARLETINAAIRRLVALPKPTIAAVNGVAAGIGASLVLACDLAIAAQSASFTFSWVRLGLVPDGGASWLLTRLVGPRRARELLLSARHLSASEALAWGLVNQVVADEQVLERARTLAHELTSFSPHALRHTKALIDQALTAAFAAQLVAECQAQAECVETAEFHAAVAAFLERRSASASEERG
jgi:2-(1,2-epoxy-1,2-dihydrophenyl)acetyl-CoA isomerase